MDSLLLVDDEKDLLDSLSTVIRRELTDVPLKSTSQPREALQWLKLNRPSVLITDVRMPEISGLDLIEAAVSLWGNLPIIIITAFASPEVDEALRLGTFHYLPKPFRNRELLNLLKTIVHIPNTPSPAQGFQGTVAVSMLADVVQLHSLSGSNGILQIKTSTDSGAIFFQNGTIIHAQSTQSQGREAFNSIMGWAGGSFAFVNQAVQHKTIHVPTNELLLDAMRVNDELNNLDPHSISFHEDFSIDFGFLDPSTPPKLPPPQIPIQETHTTEPTQQPNRPTQRPPQPTGELLMNNIQETLESLASLDGFIGACIASIDSGMVLGKIGGGTLNLEVAAAANSEVVKAKRKAISTLKLRENIEDILITLDKQYHLIRPSASRDKIFIYLALDRKSSNLALARMELEEVESRLNFNR